MVKVSENTWKGREHVILEVMTSKDKKQKKTLINFNEIPNKPEFEFSLKSPPTTIWRIKTYLQETAIQGFSYKVLL